MREESRLFLAARQEPRPPDSRYFNRLLVCAGPDHHRDTSWSAAAFVQAKVPVRAPKLAEAYLSPDGVAADWEKSMPSVRSPPRGGELDRVTRSRFLSRGDGLPC